MMFTRWLSGGEVAKLPNVQSTALSGSVPGEGYYTANTSLENSRGEMQPTILDLTYVDFGYLEQYKMKLLAGALLLIRRKWQRIQWRR